MSSELSRFGLNFIVGLRGTVLLEEEAELLASLQPAGIILFAKNIASDSGDWIGELQQLISSAKKAAGRDTFFVAIDHEGGRVHRFPKPVTHFPPACYWKERSEEVGQAMAQELRSLSFNLSFAPVLDVFSEPQNKVIGDRAFAQEPAFAAEAALAFSRGLESQGVLSCGKHFPGHGATIADSHFELPFLAKEADAIRSDELPPFSAFIAAQGQLIMSAHVRYPALDQENPATLSHKILRSLLREELGFQGTVVTDDLEMGALNFLTPQEKAVKAVKAGVDLLLEAYPKEELALANAVKMAEGLAKALAKGELSHELLNDSQNRVRKLQDYLSNLQVRAERESYPTELLNCQSHQSLQNDLEERRTAATAKG